MRTALVAFVSCLVALDAQAGFSVCNKTPRQTRVAMGFYEGNAWSSKGWWTIAPNACRELVPGPLNARYYYLYATDEQAGNWDGRSGFCVATTEKFVIKGRASCEAHGYDRKGFFAVDTGQAANYTQNLSE